MLGPDLPADAVILVNYFICHNPHIKVSVRSRVKPIRIDLQIKCLTELLRNIQTMQMKIVFVSYAGKA